MKFIHTSDWHIGKIVNEFHMTKDQEFVLEELFNIIEEEKPNALIIAGDLYDRSVAPVEAVELLNKVFNKILIELKTPIISIAGNHDSGERLEFGNELVKYSGLYMQGVFKEDVEKIVINDEYGPVNFYMIPYAEPAVIRELYKDETIKTYDDAMRAIIGKLNINNKERNVAIAHGYITYMTDKKEEKGGLITSDSERPLSIGGSELINASYFEKFNYTALGHLHGQQRVGSDKIRYSGSILKYSFSEVKQNKGISIVNINEHGDVNVDLKEFSPKRDFRILKGEIESLIDPDVYNLGNKEDYIKVILTDEGEILEPMAKLRAVYPNIMELTRESSLRGKDDISMDNKNYKDKCKLELFSEFYEAITGKSCSEDRLDIMKSIIEEAERREQ